MFFSNLEAKTIHTFWIKTTRVNYSCFRAFSENRKMREIFRNSTKVWNRHYIKKVLLKKNCLYFSYPIWFFFYFLFLFWMDIRWRGTRWWWWKNGWGNKVRFKCWYFAPAGNRTRIRKWSWCAKTPWECNLRWNFVFEYPKPWGQCWTWPTVPGKVTSCTFMDCSRCLNVH